MNYENVSVLTSNLSQETTYLGNIPILYCVKIITGGRYLNHHTVHLSYVTNLIYVVKTCRDKQNHQNLTTNNQKQIIALRPPF